MEYVIGIVIYFALAALVGARIHAFDARRRQERIESEEDT